MVRVLLLGRETLIRQGLLSTLAGIPDVEVALGAEDETEARRRVAEVRPDVVMLGWGMPPDRWIALVRWIREEHPGVGVLVVMPRNWACDLAWAMRAGAAGVLTAEEGSGWLAEAVRQAAKGESAYTAEQAEQARRWREEVEERWKGLTEREREVLSEMVRGRANREIAAALGVTEKTVEKHVTGILSKLGVKSRAEAILWVLRSGMWDLENGRNLAIKK